MKKILQGSVLMLVSLVLTGVVSAHVSVNPKEAVAGYAVVVVRVPNEKDVATTQVRVLVPEGVEVHGVMPMTGWQHKEVREEVRKQKGEEVAEAGEDHHDAGQITEVIWSGGRINVGEFMEFSLSVKYPAEVDKVTWKAYQTYTGGEVVPWDGTDEGHPAPVVHVLKEARVDVLEKSIKGFSSGPVAASPEQIQWLSVAAILVSVVALLVSLKKKMK